MINISEFRKQNPQYNDLTDEQISLGIHKKSYSDIPFEKFDRVFRPTTTGDWIKSLAVAPIHGAQESLASIPLQKELEQKSKAKRISELPTGLEEGTPFAKGYYGKAPSFTAITEPLPSPEQKEAAKEYLKTPIQESYAYKFYKQSQEGKIPFAAALGSEDLGYVSGQTSIKPDIQESIPYAGMKGVGQALGALPFVAFGGGPVGLSVAAIPMMSAEGVSMLERGIQQGIPEEIAVDAATKAKYLGLIDLAGLKLLTGVTKALVKPVAKKSPEVAKQLYQRVWNKAVETAAKHPRTAGTLFGFTDEAVQEIVQEIGANAIAIQDYKEAVSLFNGIKEAGGAGGLAGAILGGLLTALGIKARKMAHPKSPAQIVTPEDIAEKPQEPTAPPGEPTAPFEEVQPTPEEPKRTLLKPPTPDWVTPAPPILKIPPQKEKPVASELQSEVQDVMKRKFGSFNEAAEAALDLEEKIGVKLYPHLRNEDYVLRMSPKLHEEAIQQYQSNRQAALNIITNREALVQEPSGQELSEPRSESVLGKEEVPKRLGEAQLPESITKAVKLHSVGPHITPEGLEKLRSNPISLYSFGPQMLNKLTEDISSQFSKLPKGGISRRLGKLYRQYAGIPYWNAKVAKKLEPVYRVAQSRTNTRNEGFLKSMQGLDKWPKLTSEQKITIAKILNDLDGKQLEAVQAVPYIRREDGKLDLNPKHLEEFQEFLDTKDLDPEVNDYLYNVRLRLLEAHQTYYNYYKHDPTADQTKLEEFIQNTGFIPNYFPHNFYGEAYIEGTDSEGNLVARIPFDTSLLEKLGGKKYIKRIRERIQSDPNLRDLTFSEIKSSDEIEQFWMNSPVPIDVMSRVLDTAINHYKDSPEYRGILASLSPEQEQLAQKMSEKILKTLPSEVAHILKLKGFSHYAKRRGILGYETQDVGKVLYDYMWGLHSSIAKIEAAKEYTKLMYTLKPNKFEHTLLDKFITDNLKPYTSLDRTVDTTRAALAGIYLGAIIKSTFVNISTILTGGIPAVGLHSKSGTLMFPRAAKDIAKQFISELPEQPRFAGIHGKKDPSANHLQQDEINLMVQLLTKGTVQHQMTNELQVNLRKAESKFMNMLQAYTTFMLGGMSMTEWYGRAVTALAAYRAFRDGKIDNKKTLTKYNLTPNQKLDMSDPKNMKKAINFCADVVNYSFGEFASYNKPLMVRTGKAGKISQIGYTFRFFMHHQLEMWNNLLRHQQGLRGPAMALLSIAHTMALAGIPAGLPLMKVMMNLFSSLTGDDPEKMLREKLPENETIRDIAMYGLPTVTGVSLGGSYEIGVPEAVEDLLGVAGQIPLDIYRGVRAYQSGAGASRVMEIVFPSIFVRNILNALRGKSEGLYTLRGTPISRPDEEGIPIKYTNTDIVKKVLGFQSLEKAKLWRITQDIEKAEDFRRTKVTQLVDRFMHAYNRNDYQGMIDVYDEVIAWNIKVINDKKPEFVIDLQEGIQRRLSGKPLSGYMRLRKYKAAEAHGLK